MEISFVSKNHLLNSSYANKTPIENLSSLRMNGCLFHLVPNLGHSICLNLQRSIYSFVVNLAIHITQDSDDKRPPLSKILAPPQLGFSPIILMPLLPYRHIC